MQRSPTFVELMQHSALKKTTGSRELGRDDVADQKKEQTVFETVPEKQKFTVFEAVPDRIFTYDTTKDGILRLINEFAVNFAKKPNADYKNYEERMIDLAVRAVEKNASVFELQNNLEPNIIEICPEKKSQLHFVFIAVMMKLNETHTKSLAVSQWKSPDFVKAKEVHELFEAAKALTSTPVSRKS